jgi:hypothetical protein
MGGGNVHIMTKEKRGESVYERSKVTPIYSGHTCCKDRNLRGNHGYGEGDLYLPQRALAPCWNIMRGSLWAGTVSYRPSCTRCARHARRGIHHYDSISGVRRCGN